jgi:hypothetical protein
MAIRRHHLESGFVPLKLYVPYPGHAAIDDGCVQPGIVRPVPFDSDTLLVGTFTKSGSRSSGWAVTGMTRADELESVCALGERLLEASGQFLPVPSKVNRPSFESQSSQPGGSLITSLSAPATAAVSTTAVSTATAARKPTGTAAH